MTSIADIAVDPDKPWRLQGAWLGERFVASAADGTTTRVYLINAAGTPPALLTELPGEAVAVGPVDDRHVAVYLVASEKRLFVQCSLRFAAINVQKDVRCIDVTGASPPERAADPAGLADRVIGRFPGVSDDWVTSPDGDHRVQILPDKLVIYGPGGSVGEFSIAQAGGDEVAEWIHWHPDEAFLGGHILLWGSGDVAGLDLSTCEERLFSPTELDPTWARGSRGGRLMANVRGRLVALIP